MHTETTAETRTDGMPAANNSSHILPPIGHSARFSSIVAYKRAKRTLNCQIFCILSRTLEIIPETCYHEKERCRTIGKVRSEYFKRRRR